ncbi:ATP-dependent DNA helicase II subunit 1 [Microbotryomycetes sp. JL201]|nr:ATP-dependent DNA helicase II subunit 1 [Microbotryomycetes sp. JL201]
MASSYGNTDWYTGGEGEEVDEAVEEYFSTSEAFLFLIEATDTMLQPFDEPMLPTQTGDASQSTLLGWKGKEPAKSKMELCLRCALAMMRRKVISSPKDKIGILIYNTATTSSDVGGKNYHVLHPLELPTARAILSLRQLLEEASRDPEFLARKYRPNTGQNATTGVLSHVSTIFRQEASNKRINKHIMLITDNDDPVQGIDQLRNVAMQTRHDFATLNYTFDGTFIPPTSRDEFDLDKFFGPLIAGNDGEYGDWPTVVKSLPGVLNDLLGKLRTKEATKRVAFKVPFILADGFRIGVCGYSLVGDEKKRPPIKVDLNSRTGQELVTELILKDSMTAQEIVRESVRYYFSVGVGTSEQPAPKLFFDDKEVRKLKTLGMDPCLKLLGFAPREGNINIRESVKHSYFIYPEEEAYVGSTRTFSALLKSMIKKDVIGYGVLLARVISRPQIVLMMAQEEKMRSDGTQERPAGIHLIQLPFADDLRELDISATNSVIKVPEGDLTDMNLNDLPDQPPVRIATKIVKKLNTVYNPDNYPNPALNYHYETLAALALGEDLPEPEDKTLPKVATIDTYAGNFISELRGLIQQDSYDPNRVKVSKKKNDKAAVTPKEEGSRAELEEFAQELKSAGRGLKNDDIKAGLRLMNEKVGGNKAELYERAVSALKERGLM